MAIKRFVNWFFRPEPYLTPITGVTDLATLSLTPLNPRSSISGVVNTVGDTGILVFSVLDSGSTVEGFTLAVENLAVLNFEFSIDDSEFVEVLPIADDALKSSAGISEVFTNRTLSDEAYEVTNYIEVGP